LKLETASLLLGTGSVSFSGQKVAQLLQAHELAFRMSLAFWAPSNVSEMARALSR